MTLLIEWVGVERGGMAAINMRTTNRVKKHYSPDEFIIDRPRHVNAETAVLHLFNRLRSIHWHPHNWWWWIAEQQRLFGFPGHLTTSPSIRTNALSVSPLAQRRIIRTRLLSIS